MALINCPSCGNPISDQAQKCVHCGYVFNAPPQIICPECGAELPADTETCPKCGCPIKKPDASDSGQEPQKVEVTGVSIKPAMSKKLIGIIAGVCVALICIIFGVKQYNASNAAKLSADYGESLKTISFTMISGAADAESCGNLTKAVWSNTIYEKSDPETDKYTKTSDSWYASFNDDFNVSLGKLFSDSDYSSKIKNIKVNQETVNTMMKDMKNPPDEWTEAYDELRSFYDAYTEFTNLVVSPTGSLQDYSTNFNNLDSKVSNEYNKMKMYIE